MLLTSTKEDDARFMALIRIRASGCWEWLGGQSCGSGNKKPYGSFWVPGHGTVRAHRYASEALAGEECPQGHHRDHICNWSLCVNPWHIEVVTHAENERRRQERLGLGRYKKSSHAMAENNRLHAGNMRVKGVYQQERNIGNKAKSVASGRAPPADEKSSNNTG